MDKLVVKGAEISVQWNSERDDFISLTDIAKLKDSDNPRYIIQNWLRNRNTIEFLGVWESLYNPSFNRVEFDAFRSQAGLNSFVMTPQKWVEATGAIGIVSKAVNEGRLLEQFFWTVLKVGPRFISKALLFKGFAVTSCP